ncbi:MAG: DUF805 domain-containing protein [Bacteroidota bacterium]
MVEYVKMALNKYADFTGRSRRSEFWFFYLAFVISVFVVAFVGGLIGGLLGGATGSEAAGIIPIALMGILMLGFIVPYLAVAVRRLHDTGKSGWWMLLSLIPVGGLVLLIFFCLDSEPGANKWGPNPKTGAVADATSHLVD